MRTRSRHATLTRRAKAALRARSNVDAIDLSIDLSSVALAWR
jgi:hypothetical protein